MVPAVNVENVRIFLNSPRSTERIHRKRLPGTDRSWLTFCIKSLFQHSFNNFETIKIVCFRRQVHPNLLYKKKKKHLKSAKIPKTSLRIGFNDFTRALLVDFVFLRVDSDKYLERRFGKIKWYLDTIICWLAWNFNKKPPLTYRSNVNDWLSVREFLTVSEYADIKRAFMLLQEVSNLSVH